jgi:hypothetical protein
MRHQPEIASPETIVLPLNADYPEETPTMTRYNARKAGKPKPDIYAR